VRSITGMNCVVELVPPRTLPRTSSGKLSRAKAKKLYLAGEIGALQARGVDPFSDQTYCGLSPARGGRPQLGRYRASQ
jgi:hypothetical protein